MTHQPPIPQESQSPYPLHPAPLPEAVKQRAAEAEAERSAAEAHHGPSQTTLFGIGAAVALGAAAALSSYLYARRGAASGKAKRGASGKRKQGKASADRKAASESRH